MNRELVITVERKSYLYYYQEGTHIRCMDGSTWVIDDQEPQMETKHVGGGWVEPTGRYLVIAQRYEA